MTWYKKEFTENEIAAGIHGQIENLLLGTLCGPDAASINAVYFAAYKSFQIGTSGVFTAYFSPEVLERYPHLEASYRLVRAEMPEAAAVEVWVGVAPVAARRLKREGS
jgi:hypothetical protein